MTLLEEIENALTVLNGSMGKPDVWRESECECDPDVGLQPCMYCDIFYALARSRTTLNQVLSIASLAVNSDVSKRICELIEQGDRDGQ